MLKNYVSKKFLLCKEKILEKQKSNLIRDDAIFRQPNQLLCVVLSLRFLSRVVYSDCFDEHKKVAFA